MSADDRMTCAEAIELGQLWARRDVPAFPVAIGWDDEDQSTCKRPLTDHGHRDATTDPAALERLFNARSPRPGEAWGVGLCPGPAGYAVVDVDVKGGVGGDDTWAALRAEHGDVDTYTATTASTGLHLWGSKGEHHIGNTHDLGPGIDLRGDGGWVVAPGVRTPWGSWDREESSPGGRPHRGPPGCSSGWAPPMATVRPWAAGRPSTETSSTPATSPPSNYSRPSAATTPTWPPKATSRT